MPFFDKKARKTMFVKSHFPGTVSLARQVTTLISLPLQRIQNPQIPIADLFSPSLF